MNALRRLAVVLCIIGALNWGLIAIARFDLVAEIFGMKFGETNAATRVIYGLVGLAGVILLITELAMTKRTVADDYDSTRTRSTGTLHDTRR